MIQTRCLTDEDGDAFIALYIQGTRDFPDGFLPSGEEAATYTWEDVKPHFQTIFGAFDAETLVGFCGYMPHRFVRTKHRAEIGPFFVAPSHQGASAANTLMQAVIAQARSENIARLELYVESNNARARRFYEKNGFQPQATLKDMVRIGDTHQDDCFYTLYV